MNVQKKTLTSVFSQVRELDIFLEKNGFDDTLRILFSYYKSCRRFFSKSTLIQYTAGEVMGLFEDPVIAVKQSIRLRDELTPKLQIKNLDVGIGIHEDDVAVCKTSFDSKVLIGRALNIGKRLEQSSYGGDITISRNLYIKLPAEIRKFFKMSQAIRLKKWGISINAYVSMS